MRSSNLQNAITVLVYRGRQNGGHA
jgi:hypothetical protein